MSLESRVIFDTPEEVRVAIGDLMESDARLFTFQFIAAEAKRIVAKITLKEVELFLHDNLANQIAEANVYAALYFFLEAFREERGIPKTEKRVILEHAYAAQRS